MPGSHIDSIAIASDTAFSEEDVLSVVRSWAGLLHSRPVFLHTPKHTDSSFGRAVRRVVCADLVGISHNIPSTTRRLIDDDHDLIAAWILQGLDPRVSSLYTSNVRLPQLEEAPACWKLCEDLADPKSISKRAGTISPVIDAAIRSATIRRTFFITHEGHFGLGPAKMRPDDHLYILLGSRTPFILRKAGSRRIPRKPDRERLGYIDQECYEVVGDCYAHGLMDGEAMHQWKQVAQNVKKDTIFLRALLNQWEGYFETWRDYSKEENAWRLESARDTLSYRLRGKFDVSKLLERMSDKGLNTDGERAKSLTSDLAAWQREFTDSRDMDWTAELLKAAELKTTELEKLVVAFENGMLNLEVSIKKAEKEMAQKGQRQHVYLV